MSPESPGSFTMHLPEALVPEYEAGLLVEVPFGSQQVQGVIVRQVAQPEVSEVKQVTAILDRRISLTRAQIDLAFQLQQQTLAPFTACLGLMLPDGISQLSDTLYTFVQPPANREI